MRALGFSNRDIVALVTGSHTMGGIHQRNSPEVTNSQFTPGDTTPGVFDNDVFHQVLLGKCAIPIDCQIALDPDMRPIVQEFAKDQAAFFTQYAISFPKMSALTNSTLQNPVELNIPVHANLVAEGTIKHTTTTMPNNSAVGTGAWLFFIFLIY